MSRGLDPATRYLQQRCLSGETRQYPLPQLQLFPLDARKAYHERQGAGAAGKARGLGIQEQQTIRERSVTQPQRRKRSPRRLGQHDSSMPAGEGNRLERLYQARRGHFTAQARGHLGVAVFCPGGCIARTVAPAMRVKALEARNQRNRC